MFLAYSFAGILDLQFMLHVMLCPMLHIVYLYIITPRIMCAVPNKAVFCSSLISCFPGMSRRYFQNVKLLLLLLLIIALQPFSF